MSQYSTNANMYEITIHKRLEVLEECIAIQESKSKDYVSGFTMSDYFARGIQSAQGQVNKKILRLKSVLLSGNTPKNESIYETFTDLINACSFVLLYTDNSSSVLKNKNIFGMASLEENSKINSITSIDILKGIAKTLMEKNDDYQGSFIDNREYYPDGLLSILDELEIKRIRFLSLLNSSNTKDIKSNMYKIRDTVIDIIGYSTIAASSIKED